MSSITAVISTVSTTASRRALCSLELVALVTLIRLRPPDPDYLKTLNKLLAAVDELFTRCG
jgi:hypothetical protein